MGKQKLIITIDDIREFRAMAKEIPVDRITPFIQEAQIFDLKKLLGDPLYLDFIKKFDQTGDAKYSAYQELLNGVEYSYGGNEIEHPGLIGYLSYCTLVRFFNNPQMATRYGLVIKNNDQQSTALDTKAIAVAVAELRSNALALQVDIIKFLRARGADYPLYVFQDGSALGQTGVKFIDLDDSPRYTHNGRTLTSW